MMRRTRLRRVRAATAGRVPRDVMFTRGPRAPRGTIFVPARGGRRLYVGKSGTYEVGA
jgi:hypothetical protein